MTGMCIHSLPPENCATCNPRRVVVPVVTPGSYQTLSPTMRLRWHNGILEQCYIGASPGFGGMVEEVWQAIPSI